MKKPLSEEEKAKQAMLDATEAERAANYADDPRRDRQALDTRDELRQQPKLPVFLVWTEENEKARDAGQALPYPYVEGVNINGVQYWLERGKMHQVPVSVAVILANAGKIPWDLIPDTVEGYGPIREKEHAMRMKAEAEAERRRRYAGIGEGLVK